MVETALTDAAALARMRAAARVLGAAGLTVDTADDRDSHLRRAIEWQRYSRGPVSARHRACALDVVRGSLRLWYLTGGVPADVPRRVSRQLTRVQSSALVRTRCAALRADLAAEASALTRRAVTGYEDRVRREVARVWLELDPAASETTARREVADLFPARRRPRLENRLTTLLGAGFGTGLSLTVGRLAAGLCPGPVAAAVCGLLGLALTTWTVSARRLLAERNAAERWMLEVIANLRPALEERVLTRILAGEAVIE